MDFENNQATFNGIAFLLFHWKFVIFWPSVAYHVLPVFSPGAPFNFNPSIDK